MPNIKSAQRRMKQSARARLKNRSARARLRTVLKSVREATSSEAGEASLREAVALIDRAATRRLIHPRRAARLKSGLARYVRSLSA